MFHIPSPPTWESHCHSLFALHFLTTFKLKPYIPLINPLTSTFISCPGISLQILYHCSPLTTLDLGPTTSSICLTPYISNSICQCPMMPVAFFCCLLTSASISACLFSSSLATTIARCLPERLQLTAHSHSNDTTASSSEEIWREKETREKGRVEDRQSNSKLFTFF